MKKLLKSHFTIADLIMVIIMLFLVVIFVVPFIHVIMTSLSDATTISPGILFWPKNFTWSAYKTCFSTNSVIIGIQNSVIRSVLGAALILLVNSMAAYVIAKDDVIGIKFMRRFFLITMYVSGGLIPTYMVLSSLGLVGSFWVYIFPMLITPFFMVLIKTYMQNLPASMEEAAMIDGASYWTVYWKVILPLCTPVLSAVSLFAFINHWNVMTDCAIYNSLHKELYTLQYVLYVMLQQSSMSLEKAMDMLGARDISNLTVRMAVTSITMVPVMIIYPFVQKYFISGLMVGAVKA